MKYFGKCWPFAVMIAQVSKRNQLPSVKAAGTAKDLLSYWRIIISECSSSRRIGTEVFKCRCKHAGLYDGCPFDYGAPLLQQIIDDILDQLFAEISRSIAWKF